MVQRLFLRIKITLNKTFYKMKKDKKYILIKPYECQYGTLAEGSDIRIFRGRFMVNGGIVSPVFDDILLKLIKDKNYVREEEIIKNEF